MTTKSIAHQASGVNTYVNHIKQYPTWRVSKVLFTRTIPMDYESLSYESPRRMDIGPYECLELKTKGKNTPNVGNGCITADFQRMPRRLYLRKYKSKSKVFFQSLCGNISACYITL